MSRKRSWTGRTPRKPDIGLTRQALTWNSPMETEVKEGPELHGEGKVWKCSETMSRRGEKQRTNPRIWGKKTLSVAYTSNGVTGNDDDYCIHRLHTGFYSTYFMGTFKTFKSSDEFSLSDIWSTTFPTVQTWHMQKSSALGASLAVSARHVFISSNYHISTRPLISTHSLANIFVFVSFIGYFCRQPGLRTSIRYSPTTWLSSSCFPFLQHSHMFWDDTL